jgi:carboxymethylenebutenolidase
VGFRTACVVPNEAVLQPRRLADIGGGSGDQHMGEYITIATPNGDFRAYCARPATTPAAAVVVLHEVFGVNADIRQTCDELAALGFIGVAPDLFWRQEAGVDLSSWSDAEWQKGLALYTAYDRDTGVDDVVATMRATGKLPGATGKVAVMGFCLGGLMAFLTAARHPVDACVAYHGGDTEKYLDEANKVAAPMLMHLAEDDEFISPAAQAAIKAAFAGMPNVTIHSYPHCHHAFARHTGLHYVAEAAALANGRTADFLRETLA